MNHSQKHIQRLLPTVPPCWLYCSNTTCSKSPGLSSVTRDRIQRPCGSLKHCCNARSSKAYAVERDCSQTRTSRHWMELTAVQPKNKEQNTTHGIHCRRQLWFLKGSLSSNLDQKFHGREICPWMKNSCILRIFQRHGSRWGKSHLSMPSCYCSLGIYLWAQYIP